MLDVHCPDARDSTRWIDTDLPGMQGEIVQGKRPLTGPLTSPLIFWAPIEFDFLYLLEQD